MGDIVFTIGHSTRSFPELVDILREAKVEVLADVRTVPRSRHNPQFDQETLRAGLAEQGFRYAHWKGLGGLRHPLRGSPNTGWRNEGFRGFADYMLTETFHEEVEAFIQLARVDATAVMCAEAVPWRCHRSLIADALTLRGVTVIHLLSLNHSYPHRLTPFARINGLIITYPAAPGDESRTR